MNKPFDLSHIYSLRQNYTVIGLTGQIGSGCSEVASQLVKGFNRLDFEKPFEIGFKKDKGFTHNSYRKYRIVYNYAKENFKSYTRINYKDVLLMFLLKYSFNDFKAFLESSKLSSEMKNLFDQLNTTGSKPDFSDEILALASLIQQYDSLSKELGEIDNIPSAELYNFFFTNQFAFKAFSEKFFEALKVSSRIKRNKLLQIISSNLRKTGDPFDFSDGETNKAFTIVERINDLIKSHGKYQKQMLDEGKIKVVRSHIVIDDLRNPVEIMFFRQRFAAFYAIAVNREDESRQKALLEKYSTPDTIEIREAFWEEEYKGGKNYELFKANISACIQQADIHISFIDKDEACEENRKLELEIAKSNESVKDNTTPYFSWQTQLLKYVSLINQPGLITPSPEERCMQMAFTAKHNSGCISRHVGAAVTDQNYSIKAIGWNTTPEGLVPCVLRSADDLINPQINSDKAAFTPYEYKYTDEKLYNPEVDPKFRNELINKFENAINNDKLHTKNLKGRNVCFCFKDVRNSFAKEGKNQVHTRSLHAEENAFLQLAKYGSNGIENGKLFTTASPCELCAKKAYQLGIKVIYYIDPYPGISEAQILSAGSKQIKPRLFNGAIGNAYHWLYDPIMPYKDEITLLLGNKFDDYATQQKEIAKNSKIEADKSRKELIEKDNEISKLKQRILELEKSNNMK